MSASAIIADVRQLLAGDPVFLTGSLVAEEAYAKTNAHSDIDLFCPTPTVLMAMGQKLIDSGYKFDDRFDRVWYRWLKYGFNKWHTNSLRLVSPHGLETNLVYKLQGGNPTTSLAQVIESFDFGLLGMGYELESNSYRDLRSYLFPHHDPAGPLPMMPDKRDNWRRGFISQYNGLRETGRYAKYVGYGYDLSLVKDDLVTGYLSAALYLSTHFDQDKQQLGRIYEAIGLHIEADHITELTAASKQINYSDALDTIMEALE
jgi:hypothetical protein